MSELRFSARIVKSGSRVLVPLPFDPNQAWGAKERHYIHGSVNGHAVRGPLWTDGERFFIPLGPAWLRDTGLAEGGEVEVVLSPEGPQAGSLPEDVVSALDAEPEAKAFFESLATFYRKNYIKWIEGAKRPETRSARVAQMVALLKAGKKEK